MPQPLWRALLQARTCWRSPGPCCWPPPGQPGADPVQPAALQGSASRSTCPRAWRTSLEDLLGFDPVYAAIVLAAWLPAFAAALWLGRHGGAYRACLLPLASSLSLVAAIRLIDAFAPMPVLIYATRTLEGLLAMAVGGLLGGLLFIWLARSVVPR